VGELRFRIFDELAEFLPKLDDMIDRLQHGKNFDMAALSEVPSIKEKCSAILHELRLAYSSMSKEEWSGLVAESRKRNPKWLDRFLDELGLPQEQERD